MNKIYRLIWDADRGMLIPVSELTVSKGKSHSVCGAVVSCGVFKLIQLSAISSAFLMLSELGGISPAFAAYTADGGLLCTTSDVTAGICAYPSASGSMAIGSGSLASGQSTIIGINSKGTSGDITAVGWKINSNSNNSTIIGNDLQVIDSHDAVTVGAGWADSGNIGSMGKNGIFNSVFAASVGSVNTIQNSEYAVNLGAQSLIYNAPKAIAIGGSVNVTAAGAIAIGYNAEASDIDSIAIGVGSKTDAIVKTPEIVIRGQSYAMAGGNPTSTMSIGNTDTGVTRTITSLAAGRVNASSTDAINGSQLYAFQNAMDQLVLDNSFNFLDNDGDGVSIKNGGSLQFKTPNNNIQIDEKGVTDAGVLEVALNNNLDLTDSGSIKTGDSIVNNDGLTIANGPTITTGGIDAGGKVIGNVAAGVAGTDAVNVSQLADQGRDLTAKGLNLAGNTGAGHLNLGDTLSVLGGGSTPGSYSGANLKTDVDAAGNLNITLADAPKFGNITVNDSGRISGVEDGVDGKDAVNMDQLDDVATAANAGWNVTDAAGNAANIGPAGEVKFTSADGNLAVAQTGADDAGVISLTLNRDLDLDSVTAGNSVLNTDGLTIANGPSITTGGIDAGGKVIGNVAAGVAGTDAVNVSQLADQGRDLTAKGLNLAGNTGAGHLNLGDTLSVLGGGSTPGSYSGANLKTDVDAAGNLNITLADAPKFGNITVNDSGRISGVEDGVDGKDAVNMNQLDDVATVANAGWNVTDAAGNAANIGPAGEVKFTSADGNLDVAQTGADDAGVINLTLNRDLDLDSVTAGNSVLNTDGLTIANGPSITTGGIDAGGKVIGNVAPGVAGTDAVNVSQLADQGRDLIAKGLNLAGNTGTGHLNLGDTLSVLGGGSTPGSYSGANVKTEVDAAGNLNITLADAPKFGNVTVNDNGSGKITGLTAGTADTDAVNVGQLNNAVISASAGWFVTDENGNKANISGNGEVKFSSTDNNLTVEQNGSTNAGDVEFTLNRDLAVDSVTAGNSVLNTDGLTIANGPSITTDGIDAGGKIIGNVAPGVAGTDAVNVSQLTDQGRDLTAKGLNLAGNSGAGHLNLGDTLSVLGGGSTPGSYSGANLKTDVDAAGNLNITLADAPKFGNITINDSGRISGVEDGVDGKDAVNMDQLDDVATAANAGWNVTDAAGNAANIGPAGEVKFTSADGNLAVAQTGADDAGVINLTLNRDLDLDSVTAGNSVLKTDGLTIANGPSITTGGIDAGGKVIGNVAPGVAGTDAVNVSQLADQGRDLTAKGLNLAGNTGTGHLNLGDTLSVLGGGSTPGSYSGANLKTEVDAAGNLNITLADAPKFGNVTINDGDTGRISGVADGVDGKDAVNMNQLDDVATAANAGWNVTDAAGNAANIGPAGEVKFTSADGNLAVDQTGADGAGVINLTLNRDLDLDLVTAGNSVLNTDGLTIANGPSITTGGIDAGGKVIGNVAAGVAGTDAVNVSQLADQGRDLIAKGLNLAGNTGAGHLNLGDTLSVLGGGSTPGSYSGANLKTDVDAAGNLNITLADAPKFGNVTINDGDTGRISGVADGVDGKDAVNMDQLDEVATAANAGWNVTDAAGNAANIGPAGEVKFTSADGNLDVAQTGADGAGVISLTLNRDLDLDSVTAGNSVLNTDGLTIANGPSITTGGIDAGGKVIGNVAPGVAGTDAVNVSQLADQGRDLTAKGLNLAGNTGTGHLNLGDTLSVLGGGSTPGSYSGANLKTDVDAAGNLNITLADAPKFGNVTINDGDTGRISGVEDGVDGKDAVNMNQLDDVATVANAGWNVTDAAGNAANIGPAGEVKFASADGNLAVAQTGADDAGVINLTLNRDLDLDSVTAGNSVLNTDGLTIANGPSITTGGIDAGGKVIGNVAAGVAGTDAVNVSQLADQGRDLTAKGLNLAGNTGTGHLNLGDTLSVLGGGSTPGSYSGANLKTEVDAAGNLNITLADAPKFGNITVNDSGRISGVEDGVDGKDAVNMDQLDDVATVANAGWNVTDAAGNAANIGPAGEVKFTSADGNLAVDQTGADDAGVINLTLNRDLDLDSVTAGNSVLNTDGLTIANGPSITTGGIDAGGKVIGNVAPGVAGTDAVNVSQLADQGRDLIAKGLNLAGNTGAGHLNLGDTLSVLGGGSTPGSYSGANLKTEVDAAGNLNITLADAPKFGNITVNDSGRISGVEDGVDGKDAVNMDQLDDVATVANAGWNVTDAAGNAANIGPAGEVKFTSADGNLTVAQTGADDAGVINLTLNRDLDLDSVTAGNSVLNTDGLTIANGPSITTGGIDAGGKVIGNVAAGVAGTDAVNMNQLDDVATVANAGWNVTDAAGNAANIGPAGEVKFTSADGNLAVAQTGADDAGVISLTLNRDLDLDSVTAGNSVLNTDGLTIANGPSITTGGIDAGGKVIGNVAAGVAGTDAVNVSQLADQGRDLTAKGLNLAGNAGSGHLNLGDTLNVLGEGSTAGSYSGGNIRTNVDSFGHLNIEIADSPKFGNITINDGNRITGLADGQNLDDAVNLGQLNEVAASAGGSWNIRDANDLGYAASYEVNSGDTVTFASADENPTDLSGNLTVQHENGTVTYDLNEDLVLSSVTTGQSVLTNDGLTVGRNVMLGNTGLVINGGPSITVNGIDAGGKKITHVAAGTDATDAVNVSQLKDYGDVIINNIYNTGMKYFHTNSTLADSQATGTDSVAIGPNAVASGDNSIASGNGAISSGSGALANGHNAEATGNASVSIGENSTSKAENSVALGSGAVVTENGKNSVALGAGSVADRENTVSVGSEGNERQITNVAAGEKETDAVNVGQLNGVRDEITNIGGTITNISEGKDGMFQVNNTSNNSRPNPSGKDSLAGGAGAKASGNNSMSVGTNSSASGENSVALGNGSSSKSQNSVSLGANSIADRDNSVSVGSIGAERQITNVAAGEAPTDAVNVSQLNDAVGTINQNTNNKFGQLKNMVEKQGRKMSAGVAGAMAMAGLPQPYSPGASMVAMGRNIPGRISCGIRCFCYF